MNDFKKHFNLSDSGRNREKKNWPGQDFLFCFGPGGDRAEILTFLSGRARAEISTFVSARAGLGQKF